MGFIKQLKQLGTNIKIYPITKSSAVYDDNLGRLDNILGGIDTLSDQVDALEQTTGSFTTTINSLNGQINSLNTSINNKADKNVTFTQNTTAINITSGETISVGFGKIAKIITDFLTHITTNGNANTSGHVTLSDTYTSAVTNGKAANGMSASQYAVYSAYNALTTKYNNCMTSNGAKTSTTLDFYEVGIYKVTGLTKTNSPSINDTQGVLVNCTAMNMASASLSIVLQIFYGKDTNQVHARLLWADSWANTWVKLSN